jgi:hypothetical protein
MGAHTITVRSNHILILCIDPALLPLLGFDANNKFFISTQPQIAQGSIYY